ncbi:hypothetical protein BV133_3031 [Blastochloris viridis]|uniref:Uncharacterized protein n=1 Tax=Blastochloris viridis TaxID=1079 RepID=A0A182D5D8_BLAVI|nr:hypothetical protein BV133_3031 [Blastochloris viridis]
MGSGGLTDPTDAIGLCVLTGEDSALDSKAGFWGDLSESALW